MRKLLLLVAVVACAAAAVPAFAATTSVKLVDNAFSPRTKTISKGTTVVFRNAGRARHDVVSNGRPARFSSPLLRSGRTYRKRFTRKGRYTLLCTIHSGMRMTLRVR